MRIGIIGAPSSGKSAFARSLSSSLTTQGSSCELITDFASQYIEQAGLPEAAWEQLIIATGQHLAEQRDASDYVVTDAAAFATYIYAQRVIPKNTDTDSWPKDRMLLDTLQQIARASVTSYDLIFLLTHIFPPEDTDEGQAISHDIEQYLTAERANFIKLKANETAAVNKALKMIEQHSLIIAKTV